MNESQNEAGAENTGKRPGRSNGKDAVDRLLAKRMRNGDERTLVELLDRSGTEVRARIIQRFGRVLSADEVEDVLSRALFRVWTYRDRYDPAKSPLSRWFYLLARSEAIDMLRQRAREKTGLEEYLKTRTTSESPGPDELCADPAILGSRRTVELNLLRQVVEGLSEIDRRILWAFADSFGQGNWAAGLAKELGIPAATVRSRKLRATARVRRELERHGVKVTPGEATMSQKPTPADQYPMPDDRRKEIDEIAARLKDYLEKRGALDTGDGWRQFAMTWNAAVEDKTVHEPQRQTILINTYKWLSALASSGKGHREKISQFIIGCLEVNKAGAVTIARQALEVAVERFEMTLAGLSAWIEKRMPDSICRDGQGVLQLRWEPAGDAEMHWTGGTASVGRLGEQASAAFRTFAHLPHDEAKFFSARLVDEIGLRHGVEVPCFHYPPGLAAGQRPDRLVWRISQVEPTPDDKLPDWLKQSEAFPDVAPSDLELRLYRDEPQLADLLDRVVCAAAAEDVHRQRDLPERDEDAEPPPKALKMLIEAIAQRVGCHPSQIGDVVADVLRRRQRHPRNEQEQESAARTAALAFLWSEVTEPVLNSDPE